MSKSKFHQWSLQLLIIVSVIFVLTRISFLFQPIGTFISTVFFPILITGFLFFLLNPLVTLLQRWKVPKVLSILITYFVFFVFVLVVMGMLLTPINKQITALFNAMPMYINKALQLLDNLSHSSEFISILDNQKELIETGKQKLLEFANTLPNRIIGGISNFIGIISNIAIIFVTVPFLLFYAFKDGHKFPNALSRFFPSIYREEALSILKETGDTLSAYIQGQVTVAFVVGTLSFIGYQIIDLPYPLVMALIVAVTNIIPYIGPLIGGAPAVIVAFFDTPGKALLVILVILIAQQIEGNVLAPLILGKNLDIHPATIIIILIAAGKLAGPLGMVLAVPFYAVVKIVVLNIIKFLKAKKRAAIQHN